MGGALDPAVARGRAAVRAVLADLDPGARVVVGVSGGADSLALAAVSAFVADRDGHRLEAVVVDHRLQAGSERVAADAVATLGGLGVAARVEVVDVTGPGGPEAAARRARYAALLTDDPDALLVAHTLDDQAETVLLGLGRGSGARSLAGMPAVDGRLRRPFLGLRRADTEQICRASGLTWWTDPHNVDPAYRRSRVRTEVLPLLEDVLGGGVAEALARTAAQLQDDAAVLDATAAAVDDPLDVTLLLPLAPAVRTRVLRAAALAAGASASDLAAHHVHELDRLVVDWRGQARVELPGAVACRREGHRLIFVPTPVAG